jgi:transposase-like protein
LVHRQPRRTSPEQRRRLLTEFERTGLPVAEFARRAGLKYSTFARWVQGHRRAPRSPRQSPVRWLEAVVAPAAGATPLLVHLPGGARLELQATRQLPLAVALLHALAKPC